MKADAQPGRSRTPWIVTGVVAVAAVLVGAVALATRGDDGASEGTTAAATTVRTEAVVRRDLVDTVDVTGVVGYGTTTTLAITAAATGTSASTDTTGTATGTSGSSTSGTTTSVGTITALPPVGSTIARGQPIAEVDGGPGPILLWGARPMWRQLYQGVAAGSDVTQLEENLVALGYGDGITVDDEFDSATADAVIAWQTDLGTTVDGIVDPADVVFADGDVRVAAHQLGVGDKASGSVLAVTRTVRVVTADLDSDQLDLVAEGDQVPVTLEGGQQVTGTVTAITATTSESSSSGPGGGSGETTVTTTYSMDGELPADATALEGSTATISLERSRTSNVLAVPVKSLLALAEGGYAVQRSTGSGTQLVAVTPGDFQDGWVAVDGDLAEGDQVVVP